jgi:hypothetical protein
VAALVPGDHPIAAGKAAALAFEHVGIQEEAVTQRQRRARAAGVLVGQPLAPHLGDRH